MLAAMVSRPVLVGGVLALALTGVTLSRADRASGSKARARITVWEGGAASAAYGGSGYGAATRTTGAMISEQRRIEIAEGRARLTGVPSSLDPATVQVRDLTDPTSTITEQRFVSAAATPTEILAQHVGGQVTVVTAKAELVGLLRSVDDHVVVVETGRGDQQRLHVVRREGVLDISVAAKAIAEGPSLSWRIATKRPGAHDVEVSYRTEGVSWTPDYVAVLDVDGTTVDFSALATVRNQTSAGFDDVELTLVASGSAGGPATARPGSGPRSRVSVSYPISARVELPASHTVQVPFVSTRPRLKGRPVVVFEAMPDPSAGFQEYPNTDCSQFSAAVGGGRSEVAIEIDVATKAPLPDGPVRAFRRSASGLELLGEHGLRSSAGVARISLSGDATIVGDRRALACDFDEDARTLSEKIEVKVENPSKRPLDVVVREYAWRWPTWRLVEQVPTSANAGMQALEYRVTIPAGGKRTVTYRVDYAW